jgi:hypothetical protein
MTARCCGEQSQYRPDNDPLTSRPNAPNGRWHARCRSWGQWTAHLGHRLIVLGPLTRSKSFDHGSQTRRPDREREPPLSHEDHQQDDQREGDGITYRLVQSDEKLAIYQDTSAEV